MDHYADAFFVKPGQCWRMMTSPAPGREWMLTHCEEPVVWRGRNQDRNGRWHVVDSCDGHTKGLVGAKKIARLRW